MVLLLQVSLPSTITDADNCTYLVSVAITEPLPLVLCTSSTPDVCRNSNGSASVTPSGGTPPYFYAWDASSAVDPNIFNLSLEELLNANFLI